MRKYFTKKILVSTTIMSKTGKSFDSLFSALVDQYYQWDLKEKINLQNLLNTEIRLLNSTWIRFFHITLQKKARKNNSIFNWLCCVNTLLENIPIRPLIYHKYLLKYGAMNVW